jgi:hypothetical protein
VRRTLSIWLSLVLVGAIASAAQGPGGKATAGEQFVGTWTGTWDGAGTGGFELTLDKGKDGALAGRVSVTGEPTYKADIRTLSFEDNKMTARYDFPPDPSIEVVLAATFEGKSAKGSWSAREKASGNEMAAGGWTVTRK